MDTQVARTKLKPIRQEHLLAYWTQLTSQEKENLLKQIAALDLAIFRKQVETLEQKVEPSGYIEPFIPHAVADPEDAAVGRELLAAGEAGCLIVAGGQGSRLRFEGPKGCFPVTQFKKKSLFQLFAEKTLAAGKQAGRTLPLTIMTSPQNHEETQRFFKEHHYFGLKPGQISFFMQGTLPLLDKKGNLFLESHGKIAEGPDGNGGSLAGFVSSGIWKDWHDRGVRYLNYVLIDNPLADPFDARLLGHLKRTKAQVTIKAIERLKIEEKVGVLVRKNGQVRVVEYSEMPETEAKATDEAGKPQYGCANISLFAFTMDFAALAARHISEMPLHQAFKAVNYLADSGKTTLADVPNAWKFETFIFDILEYAKAVNVLLYTREECFAPLKSLKGEGSLQSVQEALQERDRGIIKDLTKIEAGHHPFELAQDFYYPTPQITAAMKGKRFSLSGYIEP